MYKAVHIVIKIKKEGELQLENQVQSNIRYDLNENLTTLTRGLPKL
jgi:hypothetical protein